MPKIGVIGGSGLYEIEGLRVKGVQRAATPYGEPSDAYRVCELADKEFVFLSRHGSPHHIPPHRINYRANIWGFMEMGVERIMAVSAVGGIKTGLRPGDVVIPYQIIDMTHGRSNTFYDKEQVVHIDFTEPYCRELRASFMLAGKRAAIGLKESGVYVCTNGPRLETRAEIRAFAAAGADIVGMTSMPEACLARELEICYGGIAVVTNEAAGMSESKLTAKEVVETMKMSAEIVKRLLMETLSLIPEKRECECRDALKEAGM